MQLIATSSYVALDVDINVEEFSLLCQVQDHWAVCQNLFCLLNKIFEIFIPIQDEVISESFRGKELCSLRMENMSVQAF